MNEPKKFRHGSLFSGIGGFDLAAQWMDWENVFHCEWNPFGKRILNHYWPNAESFDDITKTDFSKYYGTIDLISGGFPCQPYSTAGKRLGNEDERHLWPHMLRAISEIAPRWVVGENVRGLTNWNGGLVFDQVCIDLENLGYQVAPYLIPACAVNAPHKRERIWFIAYRDGAPTKHEIQTRGDVFTSESGYGNASDTVRERLERSKSPREYDGQQRNRSNETNGKYLHSHGPGVQFENFPTQSPLCGGNDGIPSELDGFTFSKWRIESIKAFGNAVVPQVVLQIFKTIEMYEQQQQQTVERP